MLDRNIAAVARRITRREISMFARTVDNFRKDLEAALKGARVLVVGAGGSIGSQTALQLLPFSIAQLDLVDVSENYLADTIRHVRNLGTKATTADVRTFVIDYGSPIMEAFLASERGYDFVLNFAAQKHVRSERDAYSLLSMVHTNLIKLADFKGWLALRQSNGRFFSVSTDKAANPVSMMGASKRIMEDVAIDLHAGSAHRAASSARFANVAFSNGSLLEAFSHRLQSGQPLAAPRDTRRYFLTLEESGQLCLLASILADNARIYVPTLVPERELITLEECAETFLAAYDLAPLKTTDPAEAIAFAISPPAGKFPLLLTPLDTGGEKPYEEFAGANERIESSGFEGLGSIAHQRLGDIEGLLAQLVDIVRQAAHLSPQAVSGMLSKEMTNYIPNFEHAESKRNLDQRL